jgi:5-methylcytosine-specific restriction endonuclease McrA
MKPKWHWSNQPKSKIRKALRGMSKGWGRKPITRVTLVCRQCGKDYETKKSAINRSKYCSRECFDKSKKGIIPQNIKIAQANSPIKKGNQNLNWKGGITPYPKEWTGSLHHRVWVRDKNTCQKCGKKGVKRTDLVVHHKDFTKKNCGIDNLILFCRSCHMKVHWQENRGVPGLKAFSKSLSRIN